MTPSTLRSLAAVALVSVLAPHASRDLNAAPQFAVQLRRAAEPPDEAPWPPADASWPGKDGVTGPRLLHEVVPHYTSDAMRAKIKGKVALECVVETDGTVARVHVVRSLDKLYGLDEQAVNAAKQWRFEPGTRDSVAIPVLITIDMAFTMAP